jgi:D-alanine-D-alanine ligase
MGKFKKIIGFTFDVREEHQLRAGEPQDQYAEMDKRETIDEIIKAIQDCGHEVLPIGDAHKLLALGEKLKVDIVFNIAEGLYGRNRESEVPQILELMGIPFVGSDALTLGLSLDKVMAKKVFITEDIRTPAYFEAKSKDDLKNLKLKFPLFVKPRFEGSSKGLDGGSLVRDFASLEKRALSIIEKYKQSALIEEFISGKEFTVAIIGNKPAHVYEPIQVKIKGKLELGDLFYSFAHLDSPELEYIYPPQISKKLSACLCAVALKAYNAVDCRDFGRVDLRVNALDEIFVLEVNPLPSLCSEDVFVIIAQHEGREFSDIIAEILNAAFKRYKFSDSREEEKCRQQVTSKR